MGLSARQPQLWSSCWADREGEERAWEARGGLRGAFSRFARRRRRRVWRCRWGNLAIPIESIRYARSLDDGSYLRRHVEDLSFLTDSQADQQGSRSRGKKRYLSGCQKRKRYGLRGDAFECHKYGSQVTESRQSNLTMRTRQNF